MSLKVGVAGIFFTLVLSYAETVSGQEDGVQSPPVFGYIPYTYRVSMVSDFRGDILDIESSIYFNSPMGLVNSIIRYSGESILLGDANSSTQLIDDILDFAMEIYAPHDNDITSATTSSESNSSVKKMVEQVKIGTEKSKNINRDREESPKSGGVKAKIVETDRGKKEKKEPKRKEKVIYVVKKGDSFIKLAKEFNTTVFDIKRWNGIKDRNIVRIDEKLIIYPNRRTPYEKIKFIRKLRSYGRYRVQLGDTLSLIVKRFAVGKKETIELNRLKSTNSIRVGQKLIIPLPQKKIDTILRKIEIKKRAKRIAIERKKRLDMAKRGKYRIRPADIFRFKRKLRVIATAYTSHRTQTDNTPFLAAWNNRIRPGMKVIAVSNDLILKYGITNGTRVRISGLPGVYVVRDKMHPRLRRHIDIYMGTNLSKALRWGRRRVILYW